MDKIVLTGLHFYGYHGCLPEEKRHGQPFHIDLVLETDLERAGQTDDLTQTVDYSAVYGVVKGRRMTSSNGWARSLPTASWPSSRRSRP